MPTSKLSLFLITFVLALLCFSCRAQGPEQKTPAIPGPMLQEGTVELDTPEFTLKLVRSSQTAAALIVKGSDNFDFTPGDLLTARSHDGYYHLGDLDLQLRIAGAQAWKSYSTSFARTSVLPLPPSPIELAAADLAPTLPADI